MTQLLMLLAMAVSAASLPSASATTDQAFESEVKDLRDAVASPSADERQVYEDARDIFDRMNETKVNVKVQLRGWDKGPGASGVPADIARLMQAARKRLSDLDAPAPPQDLKGAMAYAAEMHGGGKINLDGGMQDNQMGAYEWVKSALGNIKINRDLAYIAGLTGDLLAFATIAHESGHARDHQCGLIDGKNVIDGEVRAFKTQYNWLKIADPYGERTAWMRAKLMAQQRENPNELTFKALAYLEHLAKLHDTEGDEVKLREFVHQLGYEDKPHRHGDDPHSA